MAKPASTVLYVPLIIPRLPVHRPTKKRDNDRVSWTHQPLAAQVAVRLRHLTAVLECYFSAGGFLKVFILA